MTSTLRASVDRTEQALLLSPEETHSPETGSASGFLGAIGSCLKPAAQEGFAHRGPILLDALTVVAR
jgi:hypothetical protein